MAVNRAVSKGLGLLDFLRDSAVGVSRRAYEAGWKGIIEWRLGSNIDSLDNCEFMENKRAPLRELEERRENISFWLGIARSFNGNCLVKPVDVEDYLERYRSAYNNVIGSLNDEGLGGQASEGLYRRAA